MDYIYGLNPRGKHKRSHSKKRSHHGKHYSHNPGKKHHRRNYSGRHRRRHYRRNPSLPLIGSIDMMTILAAGAGALGARYLGKQVLEKIGQPDSGITGALGTFGTGLIASYVVRKLLKQPKLANGILIGAGAAALMRAGDEMIFQGKGLTGFLGLGTYVPEYDAAGGGLITNFTPPGSRLESRFKSRF